MRSVFSSCGVWRAELKLLSPPALLDKPPLFSLSLFLSLSLSAFSHPPCSPSLLFVVARCFFPCHLPHCSFFLHLSSTCCITHTHARVHTYLCRLCGAVLWYECSGVAGLYHCSRASSEMQSDYVHWRVTAMSWESKMFLMIWVQTFVESEDCLRRQT